MAAQAAVDDGSDGGSGLPSGARPVGLVHRAGRLPDVDDDRPRPHPPAVPEPRQRWRLVLRARRRCPGAHPARARRRAGRPADRRRRAADRLGPTGASTAAADRRSGRRSRSGSAAEGELIDLVPDRALAGLARPRGADAAAARRLVARRPAGRVARRPAARRPGRRRRLPGHAAQAAVADGASVDAPRRDACAAVLAARGSSASARRAAASSPTTCARSSSTSGSTRPDRPVVMLRAGRGSTRSSGPGRPEEVVAALAARRRDDRSTVGGDRPRAARSWPTSSTTARAAPGTPAARSIDRRRRVRPYTPRPRLGRAGRHLHVRQPRSPRASPAVATKVLRIHVRSHRDRREAVPRRGRHRARGRAARRRARQDDHARPRPARRRRRRGVDRPARSSRTPPSAPRSSARPAARSSSPSSTAPRPAAASRRATARS